MAVKTVAVWLILLARLALPGEKATLVVFDFTSPGDAALGRRIARTFRMKFEREDVFEMPDVFEMNEIIEESGFKPTLDDARRVAAFAREKLKADIVLWGDASRDGDTYFVSFKVMDLRRGMRVPFVDEKQAFDNYPAISAAARRLTGMLTGSGPRQPFASPPEGLPGPNLLANGDFEQGHTSPEHWQNVNGLTSFWHLDPGPHKRCIRIDTDVYEREVLAWQKKLDAGAPLAHAPAKTPTTGPKYDTIAGTYGVPFYSAPIAVKPGVTYRLSADVKGKWAGMFFPKVFVKGYRAQTEDEFGAQEREIYRCYLAVRTTTGGKQWEHFSRVFHPTKATPAVKAIRVMLYAYWPPGVYYFDNVRVCEQK